MKIFVKFLISKNSLYLKLLKEKTQRIIKRIHFGLDPLALKTVRIVLNSIKRSKKIE